jgi:hypothetical protein
MIGLIITDEEIAEDKRAFQYFHSLRKGGSSKRERWDAWMRCEDIRRKWQWRAWRTHPVAPRALAGPRQHRSEGVDVRAPPVARAG